MTEELRHYEQLMTDVLKDDSHRDAKMLRIQKGVSAQWEVPSALKKLPFIQDRKFAVSVTVANARNAAVRTFASRMPKLSILPLEDDPGEYERTERLENIKEWEFKRSNRRSGKGSSCWDLVEGGVTYHSLAFQTRFLPQEFKGREMTPRMKAMLRDRNWDWVRHQPWTVHSRATEGTLGPWRTRTVTLSWEGKSGQALLVGQRR